MQSLVSAMPFKERLKAQREKAGLTQQALAMRAGIAMSAVAQMESGTIKNPRHDPLKALAKALGRPLDERDKKGSADRNQAASAAQTKRKLTMDGKARKMFAELRKQMADVFGKLSADCADALWEAEQALESAGLSETAQRIRQRREAFQENVESAIEAASGQQ
jgi:transcriptional regulator with XRE-family HTH domain